MSSTAPTENRPDGVHMTVCTLDEEYISAFGEYGEGNGQFVWPTAVSLDSDDNVYVADEWLNRITKFTRDGEYVSKWGRLRFRRGRGSTARPAWPSTPTAT